MGCLAGIYKIEIMEQYLITIHEEVPVMKPRSRWLPGFFTRKRDKVKVKVKATYVDPYEDCFKLYHNGYTYILY